MYSIMYSIRYNCDNCGHSFSKDFQKGVKAPLKVECERCGCFTALKKTWPERITIRDFISPRPSCPDPLMWPRWDSNRTGLAE